jgi:hypothetical protein
LIPYSGSHHGTKFFSIGHDGTEQNLNKILLETRDEEGNAAVINQIKN